MGGKAFEQDSCYTLNEHPNAYENPNRACGDRDSSGVSFAFDWS